MKIVLDTNVLVSGVFWGGLPEKILESVVAGDVVLYASQDMVREYFRILDKIGKKNADLIGQWKILLIELIMIVEPKVKIKSCRDTCDNMFLECAVTAKAQYIVSGDDDLLSMKEINGIQIVTPREYLNTNKKR